MAKLIDGKAVAQKIKNQVAVDAAAFTQKTDVTPCLATVLVGADPASQVYVRNKNRTAEACGLKSVSHHLDATTSEADLLSLIRELNCDSSVHGILVQLPLPPQVNSYKVIEAIDPRKDVDCFHPTNVGLLSLGRPYLKPCTPAGVMALFEHEEINLTGQDVLMIGCSNIVGKPLTLLMQQADATVTMAHRQTKNLAEKAVQADIIVVAAGVPRLVTDACMKPGVVLIDVGINRLDDGSLCGDVDFEAAQSKASAVTPVPGGVGPMTIAMLMVNTLKAAEFLTTE